MEEQAAGVDLEKIEKIPAEVDQYGELGDCANEYLTVSSNKATRPLALCLNTEEVAKVFDEIFAYLIFQRRDLLDDYVALSFKEMKEKMDDSRTPFTSRQFLCPILIDEESRLPGSQTRMSISSGSAETAGKDARLIVMSDEWMRKDKFEPRYNSLLICENFASMGTFATSIFGLAPP